MTAIILDPKTFEPREVDASQPTAEELEFASTEFEPVNLPIEPAEWAKRTKGLNVSLGLAAVFLRLRKPELVAFVRAAYADEGGIDDVGNLVKRLQDEAIECRDNAELLDAAMTRLLCAGSVVAFIPPRGRGRIMTAKTFKPPDGDPEPGTLAALIAEERRAWDAQSPPLNKAEEARWAWEKAHPGKKKPPAAIAALEAEAEAATAAADALTERVVNWIPDNLADAILLLEFIDADAGRVFEPGVPRSVIAGLRIIAAGDPVDAEPVLGDRRILGLFREWRARGDQMDAIADGDDNGPALARLRVIEKAIADMPAEGVIGLAVKSCLSLWKGDLGGELTCSTLRDVARFVPELAPLSAMVLEEEEEEEAAR